MPGGSNLHPNARLIASFHAAFERRDAEAMAAAKGFEAFRRRPVRP